MVIITNGTPQNILKSFEVYARAVVFNNRSHDIKRIMMYNKEYH